MGFPFGLEFFDQAAGRSTLSWAIDMARFDSLELLISVSEWEMLVTALVGWKVAATLRIVQANEKNCRGFMRGVRVAFVGREKSLAMRGQGNADAQPMRKAIKLFRWTACAALLCASSACTTAGKLGEGMGNMADKALETIGFKKPELPKMPELPESAKPPRLVRLQVSASDSLNLDPRGNSLALVVRVYKLRAPTSFLNAPIEAFGDPAREKQAMGEDLIDVKELTLSPGFRRELSEKWAREAAYVGVAGLFMTPAPQRWRYVFDVAEPIDQPFLIGAHSCALSVGVGTPIGIPEYTQRVLPTDCAPPGSLAPRSTQSSARN